MSDDWDNKLLILGGTLIICVVILCITVYEMAKLAHPTPQTTKQDTQK